MIFSLVDDLLGLLLARLRVRLVDVDDVDHVDAVGLSILASFSLNSRVVRCQGTEKSLKASPKIRSYFLLSWFRSTNWRASPQVVLIGVSRGQAGRHDSWRG